MDQIYCCHSLGQTIYFFKPMGLKLLVAITENYPEFIFCQKNCSITLLGESASIINPIMVGMAFKVKFDNHVVKINHRFFFNFPEFPERQVVICFTFGLFFLFMCYENMCKHAGAELCHAQF